MDVNLRGAEQNGHRVWTPFITFIDYDAKGQRTICRYANGMKTVYEYDAQTFRLVHLKTTRMVVEAGRSVTIFSDPRTIQDLRYTYDPLGNITRLEDGALKTVFHANHKIEPACEYTYDPIYRLIEATGREHIGQSAFHFLPEHGDDRDYPFEGAARLNDLQALQRYAESYAYDPVGNVLSRRHRSSHRDWTRTYSYHEASLLEPRRHSNRLSETALQTHPGAPVERYSYDAHGNMTRMSHLPLMGWDYKNQLSATSQQVADAGERQTTHYVYDAGGQRSRKVTERDCGKRRSERFYVGGFELFREFAGDEVSMERETLHIMDDKRRIALVETKTAEDGDALHAATSTQRYQLANHLGSACLEVDEAGGLITFEEYSPYGDTTYQAGTSAAEVSLKRYRYTGKERDEEMGLYYHGARYYAPWLGRWTACDPKGIDDGLTAYWYARDNPSTLVDPRGTDTTTPETTPKEQVRREQWRKEYTQKALTAAGEAVDARKQITRLQHLGARDMFPYMKEPNLDKAEELRFSLIATYENIEHHAKVATLAYVLAAQYGPPPEQPPPEQPEPRFQFDVQDKDSKGLHLDAQVSGVYNELKKGQPAFASVDTQATLPLKDYALLKYNAIHGILEISAGHEPAIGVTELVHIKDPSDTSKVTGHTQFGAQVDALDIDIKKGERDIVELKVTLAGSYDVKSGSGQGQVQVGAEAHVTPKSFSIVGQAQFPFNSSSALPPSYGGGVLWHF